MKLRELRVSQIVTVLEVPLQPGLEFNWRGWFVFVEKQDSRDQTECNRCRRPVSAHLQVRVLGGDEKLVCPESKVFLDLRGKLHVDLPGKLIEEREVELP